MNRKSKLQVIIGGKEKRHWTRLQFISALATKTRLMGVVALKIHWREGAGAHFVQWFLLDAEEHGIAEYSSVRTQNSQETGLHTERFMGGLGGERVELNQKEAMFLVKSFGRKNSVYQKPLPQPTMEYRQMLKIPMELQNEAYWQLKEKICEAIRSPIELVNFFLMRAAGNDMEGMTYLISDEAASIVNNFRMVRGASILMKNEVSLIGEGEAGALYSASSLVDTEGEYLYCVSNIEVKKRGHEYKINKAQLLESRIISTEDGEKELEKKEYALVYEILDNEESIIEKIESMKARALRYDFPAGVMFVVFKKMNDHVKEHVYYLSNDIQEIYFVSHFKELILCYYDADDEQRIKKELQEQGWKDLITFSEQLDMKNSVIYDYGEFGEEKFADYVSEIYS